MGLGRQHQQVVLASGNSGKLAELAHALEPSGLEVLPQSAFEVPEAIEDGITFVENALKKARNAALHTGLPAIADDSGLVVPALNGAPGIHSARYSGEGDAANNQKLLAAMAELTGMERSAWFMCVLIFVTSSNDPAPVIAEGRWHGQIATGLVGDGGFGYDPLFLVEDGRRSAAQMSKAEKSAVSHRGVAVSKLRSQLGC